MDTAPFKIQLRKLYIITTAYQIQAWLRFEVASEASSNRQIQMDLAPGGERWCPNLLTPSGLNVHTGRVLAHSHLLL